MERLGFGYERLRELRPDIVYVSNCGFGHTGPYRAFKSWGPIAQAVSGLTHTSGLPAERAGRVGATRTWTTPAATSWPSPCSPRCTTSAAPARASGSTWPASRAGIAHGRPGRARRHGQRPARSARPGRSTPTAARSRRWRRTASTRAATTTRGSPSPAATTTTGRALAGVIGEPWAKDERLADARRPARRPGRPRRRAGGVDRPARARRRRRRRPRRRRPGARRCSGRPSAATTTPRTRRGGCGRRCSTPSTAPVRVDGLPVHLSGTDWRIERGGPVLGEDNERVLRRGARADAGRDRPAGRRGGHLMGPLDGVTRGRAGARARARGPASSLADLGADVIVVEPPGGSRPAHVRAVPRRRAGHRAQPVVVALQHVQAQRRRRPRPPTASRIRRPDRRRRRAHRGRGARCAGRRRPRLADAVQAADPRLVMVSITPFGSTSERADEPVTDLTLLAEAGPVWSCGYDDHSLPPVRGGGNQAFHTAGHWAVHVGARRPAGPRGDRRGPAHRRQHARGRQRHDRDGDATAGWRRAPRCSARPAATPRPCSRRPSQVRCARRALRHDRRAAARAGRVRQRARPARPPRPARRVPVDRWSCSSAPSASS